MAIADKVVQLKSLRILVAINEALDEGMPLNLQEAKEFLYVVKDCEVKTITNIDRIIREEMKIATGEYLSESIVREDFKSKLSALKGLGATTKKRISDFVEKTKSKIKAKIKK